MKLIKYLIPGILFGIVMTKSEAISWFRIQEMFRFESIHMYGIIGTAVILGAILVAILKKTGAKTMYGDFMKFTPKPNQIKANLIGGTVFGLGWALTGACPGPMFTLIGHGVLSMFLVIASAVLGAFVYGLLRPRLPH